QHELRDFRRRVQGAMVLPPSVRSALDSIPPETPPMDVLRSTVSLLGHFDADAQDNSHAANLRKSERLLGEIAAAIGHWSVRVNGVNWYDVNPDATHGANLLGLILGREPGRL